MSPEEQADLDVLTAAIQKMQLQTYDYAVSFLRYTPDNLKHSGYGGKTIGEAIVMVLERSQAEIEKLIKAHERK